jgi:hypothetical protein
MGIINFFKKTEPKTMPPTAVEYVEWLLSHMLCTSQTELTVDSAKPLPGNTLDDEDMRPPCLPDPGNVINRLKILSGVNPVGQTGAVHKGSFERVRTHHIIVFNTQFHDEADRSTCVIQLRVRCQKA